MKREKLIEILYESIRFGIVGIIATILHYGIYLLLMKWMDSRIAYSIGYGVGFLFNYHLSAKFTFKKRKTMKNGIGFICTNVFNYVFQLALFQLFLFLRVEHTWIPLPVYAIAIPVNFLLVRFVFKRFAENKE